MPASFDFKNVPKGFGFPLTRNELRHLAASHGNAFRSVTTSGISMSEGFKTKQLSFISHRHVGILKPIREDPGWIFDLEIKALRVEDFEPWRASVAASLLRDINAYIEKKSSLPATAPSQASELFLGFEIKDGKCVSASHEVEE